MLYYILTTGAGQQTLGEEYCDIAQIAGSYGLPPTPARRALFILYQTAVPYIAERTSSRIASSGMFLTESHSDDFSVSNAPSNSQTGSETSTSSTSQVSRSSLSRLKEKFRRLRLYIIQRWPTVLPVAREVLQLFLRTNLMLFYFEGLYYHISKRASGIRYKMQALYLNCPELSDLNLTSCRNLHPERLLLQCPNLESVHATDCVKSLHEVIETQVHSKTGY